MRDTGSPVAAAGVMAGLAAALLACPAPAGAANVGFEMFSTVAASTGEKPQSKLFYNDGFYWAVLQGPDGVAFYQLVGGAWQRGQFANAVLQSSGNADVKWDGTHLFVLVYGGTVRLYQYTYAAGTRSWVLASGFPVTVPNPSGSETMVLEEDSSGRLWATAEGGGNVNVYYTTTADHRSWSSSIVLRSGIDADDISSIVAFGGDKVGVFWSDQKRDEFGFRVHRDSDPPGTWAAEEVVDHGSGHADDHVNLAFDSQGRVYAITKDAVDHMRVHRRATNGAWTTKTDVIGPGTGTRGIIMVAEQDSKVYILYTRWGVSPERIEYRVADIEALSFGGQTIFISSTKDMNNVSGMKQILPRGSLIAVAENGSKALWNGFGSPGSGGSAPGPPQSLIATLRSSPTRVDLSWGAPASGTVSGYDVYRQADGGSFQKLNSSLVTSLGFTDSSPPQAQLCYEATAVGTNGLEGAPSNTACVDTRPPGSGTIDTRIAAGPDDAEERSDGSVNLTSGDLEMMIDGTPQKVVGLRFTGVSIPAGSSVTRAYVQFQADESQSEATTLSIRGEAADNVAAFTTTSGSLTARLGAGTQATVSWPGLLPWTAGQVGSDQRTPDLSPVIREIVGRAGWRSGNALALLVTGSGHRTAVSFDGIPGAAALLHVEYTSGSVTNQAPVVNAGPDQVITLPNDAPLDGTVSDDGLPQPPSLVTTWSKASGPGTVTFANAAAVDTRASFSVAGTYLLELRASDGQLVSRDTVAIVGHDIPSSGGGASLETRIAAGPDDAEEHSDGSVSLTSSDLEMMIDGTPQKVVGLRFAGLSIPAGSSVTGAYVQFQADESQSEATTLSIRGEAADNAAAFTTGSGSLTARLGTGTQAAVSWPAILPWTAGQAGTEQRTPDLSPVIQEIVGRPGWRSGNALALLITGSGKRTAVSYDGAASGAAILHLELAASAAESRSAAASGPEASPVPHPASWVAPNPLRRDGELHFSVSRAGPVRIEVFDLRGRRVRTLLDLPSILPGEHQVALDGSGESGAPLGSGVYFYRVLAGGRATSGRFLLVK